MVSHYFGDASPITASRYDLTILPLLLCSVPTDLCAPARVLFINIFSCIGSCVSHVSFSTVSNTALPYTLGNILEAHESGEEKPKANGWHRKYSRPVLLHKTEAKLRTKIPRRGISRKIFCERFWPGLDSLFNARAGRTASAHYSMTNDGKQ